VVSVEPRSGSGSDTAASPLASLPKVGDTFLGFALVDELGRGGFGRVFLAEQKSLADRPVALKVSVGGEAESLNLARLQHTNIVPIYSAHRSGPLVAVCMPFFGRSTLGDLCSSVQTMPSLPHSGGHVVTTIVARRGTTTTSRMVRPATDTPSAAAADPHPAPSPLPNLDDLGAMTYADAVLWIGERIADGLAHAHDRGIVHRDLKPANVLVTDDGQPMILDFNLAVRSDDRKTHRGGTVPYMAPEQLRAMAGDPAEVDRRADLYALGLMLFELLAGRPAFRKPDPTSPDMLRGMIADRGGPLPSLRAVNPVISPTVEAIVHKCLAANPNDRYQSAHDLIEDLKLHRADRPVRHAANPSWRERAAKWVRRHPRLTSPPAVAAAVAGVLLAASAGVTWGLMEAKRTELARTAGRGRELLSEFDALRGTAEQYLTSHNGKPELVARGRAVGFQALDVLAGGHGERWQDRPEFAHLPDEDRTRLNERAADLVFLIGRAAGRGDAAGFWDRFPVGPTDRSPVLRAAEQHAGGKFRESIVDLVDHVRSRPEDAGGWFLLGRAHAECGNPAEAYLAYSSGIALRPRYAPGYYFRAEVADQLKRADPAGRPQALIDIDRAVTLDPEFVEARLLRAQLLVQVKRYTAARDDLDHLLAAAEPPTRAWLLRSLVWTKLGDDRRAAADRAEGLKREPTTATDFIARGVARRAADPTAALADFHAAEALDPTNAAAMQHQAYVQGELLNRPDQAADTLTRQMELAPATPLVLINRAVYLARCGKAADAVADAEKAAGMSRDPGVRYRVGCVYALAAKADPKYAAPALKHLGAALRAGFGYEHLPADTDFDPLRGRPDFDRLNDLVKVLNEIVP
jgi:serine/threonine protein kinase